VAAAFVMVLVVATWRWPALLALAALPLAAGPLNRVYSGARGRDLIAVLGATGRLHLVFGALLTLGLALGG
jgi:1,4-dihydroxy-2-naphthoate octaprenyltransferase